MLLPTFQYIRFVNPVCRQDQNSTGASVRHHNFGGRQLRERVRIGVCSGSLEAKAFDVGSRIQVGRDSGCGTFPLLQVLP